MKVPITYLESLKYFRVKNGKIFVDTSLIIVLAVSTLHFFSVCFLLSKEAVKNKNKYTIIVYD